MYKLTAFFLTVFILSALLGAVMEGGGGIASTQLNGGITAAAVEIIVDSTDGFLSADYIIIGGEEILYTAKTSTKFQNCTRGYNGTTAAVHADNVMVYTSDSSAINTALGFSVDATRDAYGAASVIAIPINFFTKTVPNIVLLNVSFLTGDLAILGLFFMGSGIAFIITLALAIIGGLRT